MRILPLLIAVVALAFSASAADLDPLLAKPGLWASKPDDFAKLPEAKPYRWTSKEHDSARAGEQDLKLFGLVVFESVARFDAGKLAAITNAFYTRGDAGTISKEDYEKLLHVTVEAITGATKVKFTARGKDASSAVHAEGLIWQTPTARYLLEYSFTKEFKGTPHVPFRAEFVRLEITPPEHTVSLLESASNTTRARFTGATHVKRDLASGDAYIADVPMVDQGEKGYCAVACTERVMRYYGVKVDENELAQVANTDSERGTNSDTMFEAVKKLGARLKVRVRPVEQIEPRQLLNWVKEYNLAAKKGSRAPQIPDPGRMIDVTSLFHAMDRNILEEVRTKNKADVGRFQREIAAHVENGLPLIWSVELGVVPEKGIPQTAGGHMRLVIGYNTKSNEILYTDSWGAGHELKRMPVADAWTITMGLTAIEPL